MTTIQQSPQQKKQRLDETDTTKANNNNENDGKRSVNVSHLAPLVAASLRDAVVMDMTKDKQDLDNRLLGVELFGEGGRVLWKGDIRQGHYEKLEEDELPYPDEEIYFPREVWTVPVDCDENIQKSKLILTKPDQVKEIRIGLHRWKSRVGDMVGLGSYNPGKQSHEYMRIPFISETQNRKLDENMMGNDSIYLAGEYAVTCPELVQNLEFGERSRFNDNLGVTDVNGNPIGFAFDEAREQVTDEQKFPGMHDELRVETVELVISGTVAGTLDLYNLHRGRK